MSQQIFTHLQLFSGIGGLSKGIAESTASRFGLRGSWECVGAIDSDAQTVAAYNRYTRSTNGVVADLFSRDQYRAFHGCEPPDDWRELTPRDLRKTFAEDLPAILLIENVQGITMRGERHLQEVKALLQSHGYSLDGSAHCLGEWGGLAQKRPRYLLVARNTRKLSPLLLQPQRKPLQTIGEVLGKLPPVGHPLGGRLHQPRKTTFRTALRLALIPPGKDWRALKDLKVENGWLKDYALIPLQTYGRRGTLGVLDPDEPAPTVTGKTSPSTGRFAFPDARSISAYRLVPVGGYGQHPGNLGVLQVHESSPTIAAARSAGSNRQSIPDPRISGTRFSHAYRIMPLNDASVTITGEMSGISHVIPDPRTVRDLSRLASGSWANGGHYGVLPWWETSGVITASGKHDNAAMSVADPRLPDPDQIGVWVIVSEDGTWHRPLTLLERAVLQDLVRPEDLDKPGAFDWIEGASDTKVAEWIGNAVPPKSARAMGGSILKCLLAETAGVGFQLTAQEIWAKEEAWQ